MKKFILGILLGGLLMSGGWFTYAAISQEVGLNTWSGTRWSRLPSTSTSTLNIPGGLQIRGNSATDSDNVPNLADGAIAVKAFIYEREEGTNNWQRRRSGYVQSTEDITTNGAGVSLNVSYTPPKNYSLQVTRTAGATDVISVNLQCTIQATTYFTIASVTTVAGGSGSATIANRPCNFLRYNVVTVGVGNTLQIDFLAGT